MSLPLLIFALIFLFAAAVLTGTTFALQTIGRFQAKEEFKKTGRLFFIQHFIRPLFPEYEWEGLFFCLGFTRQVFQLCYALCAFFFLLTIYPFSQTLHVEPSGPLLYQWGWGIATAAIVIIVSFIIDVVSRLAATARPHVIFTLTGGFSSLFLLLLLPFSYLGMKILKSWIPPAKEHGIGSPTTRIREKILEIIHESELSPHLDPHEQRLIASVASFKERITREIMVPRIDVFSLPSETPISEAVQSFMKEGYSRIPVYRENVDHVIGVLLYKDVLGLYAQASMDPTAAGKGSE